jgi:L-ribulose-5-phosphate 4-epimerase
VSRFDAIREECWAANTTLPATGLVDLTFGNVSVCDRDLGVFAIKPSGVAYAALTPADMVVVDLEGRTVEGIMQPSSDMPTHRGLLLGFPEIRSVVHTHSRSAVAFAQAATEIPLLGTTHADYFRGPVPVTRALTADEISADYEWQTGQAILERFKSLDPLGIPAVLVRNHGPFVWGLSGAKAVETAQALEIVADMALRTLTINPSAPPAGRDLAEKHFLRKHGAGAYYGQLARQQQ